MAKKYITSLTGGLNEVTRPDLLNDSEVQECVNYEIGADGILEKRTEAMQYDAKLDSLLNELYNIYDQESPGEIAFMSAPYYPPNKPSHMSNDFMLLFYGTPTPGNLNHAYYLICEKTTSEGVVWSHTDENDEDYLLPLKDGRLGLSFDGNNVPRVSIGESGIILTDSINPPLQIEVNPDGEVDCGRLTLNAPKNKPVINIPEPVATDAEYPELMYRDFLGTDENDPYVCEPGLVQIAYTVVTEDGEESNPSPLSDTADFQFASYDPEGNSKHFIKTIDISNLGVPSVSSDMRAKLEKFNIYMRVFKYNASSIPQDLQFVESFNILDRDMSTGETGNSYRIVNKLGEGQFINYENDTAPVAVHSEQIAGVTFLSGIDLKVGLPFSFDKIIPIEIDNKNKKNYVDFPLELRLFDKYQGTVPQNGRIDELDWNEYLVGDDENLGGGVNEAGRKINPNNLNEFRLYYSDLTTPMRTVYIGYVAAAHYIDIRTVVPYLPLGTTTIYLTFGGDGVTDPNLQNFENGQFTSSPDVTGSGWNPVDMPTSKHFFKYAPLLDEDVLLATDTTKKGQKIPESDWNSRNGGGWKIWNGSDTLYAEAETVTSRINKANMTFSAPVESSSYVDQNADPFLPGYRGVSQLPKYYNNHMGDRFPGAIEPPYNEVVKAGIPRYGKTHFGDLGVAEGLTGQKFSAWAYIEYQGTSTLQTINGDSGSGGYTDGKSIIPYKIIFDFTQTYSGWSSTTTPNTGVAPSLAATGCSLIIHNGLSDSVYNALNVGYGTPSYSYRYSNQSTNGLALQLYSRSGSSGGQSWGGLYNNLYLHDPDPAFSAGAWQYIPNLNPDDAPRVCATHFSDDFPIYFGWGDNVEKYKYFIGVSINDATGDVSLWMSDISGAFCNSADNTKGAIQGKIYRKEVKGAFQSEHMGTHGGFSQFTAGGQSLARGHNVDTEPLGFTHGAYIGNINPHTYQYSFTGVDPKCLNMSEITFKIDEYFDVNDRNDLNKLYAIQASTYPMNFPVGKTYVQDEGQDEYPPVGTFSDNMCNKYVNFKDVMKVKVHDNMVKWSNLHSFGMPDMNYILVGEPIRAIMKAPSFLKFQYDNTLIIFTRNNIYRFVLSGTPDQWKGRVDNLIEEYTQYGLFAPKSLVRAGDSLFWMSERGIIKWNAEGLKVISDNRINVELNEDSVGYYNPIKNQYIVNYK